MCRFGDRCRHSHDVQPWDDTEKTTTVYSKEFFGKDGYMESTADSEAKGGWSDAEEKSVATACEASLDEEEVAQVGLARYMHFADLQLYVGYYMSSGILVQQLI